MYKFLLLVYERHSLTGIDRSRYTFIGEWF